MDKEPQEKARPNESELDDKCEDGEYDKELPRVYHGSTLDKNLHAIDCPVCGNTYSHAERSGSFELEEVTRHDEWTVCVRLRNGEVYWHRKGENFLKMP